MSVDLRLSAKARLLAALNAHNRNYRLTLEDFTWGAPTESEVSDRNTRVVITATPSSQFLAQRTVLFNRLDLEAVFGEFLNLEWNSRPTTTHQLLSMILTQKDVNLQPEDILNETIPSDVDFFDMKAHPNSIGWIGTATLNMAGTGDTELGNHTVLLLEDGSVFMLDDGSILILETDTTE